ncbi:hydroxymethylglutaryl-CoA lyase [Klenkia sp. PcliD-1-E]|uniref:hydroxymethylglutaryl-CoA lyase n=1 Tax=Klenkia sp. PcliD-1-E TaxID=2954492 RepID=UPI002098594B|nr:hydroxymethylglutaryl-CoA lyase [Klenkia sp. PcliD-1-E]MCO7218549.1 hydroxymethylglutaryl-CoA lyase [Klenkia sp. PcliD-1-E]
MNSGDEDDAVRELSDRVPREVHIREEGPRDGWQNIEDVVIPTSVKVDYIQRLVRAGLRRISVTAMVHPKWVPQLADGPEVLAALEAVPGVDFGVLVPNPRGWSRLTGLLDDGAPITEITTVVSVSEAHNQANVNMSVADSLRQLEPVIGAARERGLHVSAGVATVYGCSLSGAVDVSDVIAVARALVDMGAGELTLGDTTGMANPVQVTEVLGRLRQAVPTTRLTPHFHNTRGAGLANVLAALQLGVDSFESAYGELGGCQFARGATGNIATEDLVSMLEEMGVRTGVDLLQLIDVVTDMEAFLGRRLDSHVSHAGPVDWNGRP